MDPVYRDWAAGRVHTGPGRRLTGRAWPHPEPRANTRAGDHDLRSQQKGSMSARPEHAKNYVTLLAVRDMCMRAGGVRAYMRFR